jgi:hypothetical protein
MMYCYIGILFLALNSFRVLQGAPVMRQMKGERLAWREVHVEPWYSSTWQRHLDDTVESCSYLHCIVPLTIHIWSW